MATNVFRILDALSGNLNDLKAALEPLAALTQETSGREQSVATSRRRSKGRKTSAPTAAAKTKTAAPARPADATRRQAGVYGALIGRLAESQRTQVRKVKEADGYKAAISLGEKLRKRG